MANVTRLINDKLYLKDYLITAIDAAVSNFESIMEIIKRTKLDANLVEDKKEYLKGLKYKLIIGYDKWVVIIIKEFLESLYINKRFINSLMDTFEHENFLLSNLAGEYYYREGDCTVSPIFYCVLKKKVKLFVFKRMIGLNEFHSFKLEKLNVRNSAIIEQIEIVAEKYKIIPM